MLGRAREGFSQLLHARVLGLGSRTPWILDLRALIIGSAASTHALASRAYTEVHATTTTNVRVCLGALETDVKTRCPAVLRSQVLQTSTWDQPCGSGCGSRGSVRLAATAVVELCLSLCALGGLALGYL
eukprot:COSAG02_NODE_33621_length_497_cov_1.037688_1_plen_128_part_01